MCAVSTRRFARANARPWSTNSPDWPPAARLAPGAGSVIATRYGDAETFVKMLKSGKRADGSVIAVMPFESLSALSDIDARALYLFLKSMPGG